jgi:hypothetical protein
MRNDISPYETYGAKNEESHYVLSSRPISPPQQGHKIFSLSLGVSKGVLHRLQKK